MTAPAKPRRPAPVSEIGTRRRELLGEIATPDSQARDRAAEVMGGTITIRELQRRHSISRTTIYALIDEGRLVRVHVRRRVLITLASIERVFVEGVDR